MPAGNHTLELSPDGLDMEDYGEITTPESELDKFVKWADQQESRREVVDEFRRHHEGVEDAELPRLLATRLQGGVGAMSAYIRDAEWRDDPAHPAWKLAAELFGRISAVDQKVLRYSVARFHGEETCAASVEAFKDELEQRGLRRDMGDTLLPMMLYMRESQVLDVERPSEVAGGPSLPVDEHWRAVAGFDTRSR